VHICETIEKILKYWDLSEKVYSITTDSGSNMKKTVLNMDKVMWQRCCSHTLQLVIGKALLPVESLIARAKRLIDFFLRPKQSERLEEIQKKNPNMIRMEHKDGKRLWEINLTISEWELLKELLQVLGPFEEVSKTSIKLYYILMHRVIKEIKNIFKPNQINEDELYYDNIKYDAFDDHEEEEPQTQQPRIKLNIPVDTTGLLEKVKHNFYKILCYYYPDPMPQELLSALLDPRLKSLDYMNNINR
ncbi:711_t:CDS:2, partial [Cetraspora pellucida]